MSYTIHPNKFYLIQKISFTRIKILLFIFIPMRFFYIFDGNKYNDQL